MQPLTQINPAWTALVVVDVQRGFTSHCPAELPVPGGAEIAPRVNELLDMAWSRIDATQDWHPPDHCSFLGQRDNLYPPHCIMNTPGADFLPDLKAERFHAIWRKGFDRNKEAYAVTAQQPAFVAALRAAGIKTALVCRNCRQYLLFLHRARPAQGRFRSRHGRGRLGRH